MEVNGFLEGKSVYLLGSGPSLKGFDFRTLSKEQTIAINHTIEFYPEAKMCLFGDKVFLKYTDFDFDTYTGWVFAPDEVKDHPKLRVVLHQKRCFFFEKRRDQPYLTFKKGLFHPASSGTLALNLALQMRAKEIFLLGFDYYYQGRDMHFFKDVHDHHKRYEEERYAKKALKFRFFSEHAYRVKNISQKSLIKEFPKVTLEN